jgi:hypothetical protein
MYGLGIIKASLVALALALFAVPWLHFAKETWDADATIKLNEGLVYVANLSAGVLSSAFAIVLGVKVVDGGASFGTSLTWPSAPNWTKLVLTICVWIYFIVGLVVLAVYVRDLTRTTSFAPTEVKDFALVFAGYAAAYLAVLVGVALKS